MDYAVHGILQARILEWVAFPFSRDLPNPGIKPRSPALQADCSPAEPREGKGRIREAPYPLRKSELTIFIKCLCPAGRI